VLPSRGKILSGFDASAFASASAQLSEQLSGSSSRSQECTDDAKCSLRVYVVAADPKEYNLELQGICG